MSFKRTLSRFRFRSVLRRRTTVPLHTFFSLWAASDAVYAGPVGFGAKLVPEAEAIDRVTADPEISIDDLVRGASHESPKVAASCIEALFRRRAEDCIPQSVANREEKIQFRFACRESELTISEFIGSRGRKAAQPGATDNPGIAQ